MQHQNQKLIYINHSPNSKHPIINLIQPHNIPSNTQNHQIQQICHHCSKWLRRQTKIIANQLVYCVGCFAINLPQCNYYEVMGHDSYEIIGGGWPARDELLLLEGIQRFGFGNWAATQEFMALFGANYFKDEIEFHYDKFYSLYQYPDLKMSEEIGLIRVCNPSRRNKQSQRGGKWIQNTTAVSMFYNQKHENPFYNSKRGQLNVNISSNENLQKMIVDLEFNENDSPQEIQIKFQLIEAYSQGLQDKNFKHSFILEHKILDQNYQQQYNQILNDNRYAKEAENIVKEFKKGLKLEEYLQMRNSMQFCIQVHEITQNLKKIKSSNASRFFQTLSNNEEITQKQMSKPRKKVHRTSNSPKTNDQNEIMKKLKMTKQSFKKCLQKCFAANTMLTIEDLKITPLNSLL